MSKALRTAAAALILAAVPAAGVQRMDPVPTVAGLIVGPVETDHEAMIAGAPLRYRAVFREYALNDQSGRPSATISATTYLRRDVEVERPVFFLFNGGPGASSSPLHFSAFGPRLRPPGRDAVAPFTDNADSLLDVADLVFVDPVGTGFSRVLPGGDGSHFWAPKGDAGAVLQLIRTWVRDHGRERSPIFIAGESYGAYRLATMMGDAGDLNVHGLLLISPATDTAGMAGAGRSDEDRIFSLPTMAAAAWHHERVDRRGLTVDQFVAEARAFAERDYLAALHQGSALPPEEKGRIAARMAALIGLPAETIAGADLRVSNDLFVEALLADRNQLVGRLDTRVAAPVRPPARDGRPAAANDPSLGLGATNVIHSAAITRYMREELGVPVDRDYVSLTLDVNFRWNWFEATDDRTLYHNPLRNIAAAMAERPALRLMVAGGLYDLATPVAAAHHAIRHSGIPPERVRFLVLPAGHSPFEEPPNRARFAEAVRAFVTAVDRQ
ncbi:S10 family peptidase [Sphingosinicella sp. CPCC 101087]|uniref:S10 family peptidase n=1 Tax=Sphingosinicella sp. CPCC 101087 TaxID=2497754 RepID=UPI0013EADC43|nr:peptidase S10 [Sphingosinicella sp. CPCC 101087]